MEGPCVDALRKSRVGTLPHFHHDRRAQEADGRTVAL
jgi:hypothetical protein